MIIVSIHEVTPLLFFHEVTPLYFSIVCKAAFVNNLCCKRCYLKKLGLNCFSFFPSALLARHRMSFKHNLPQYLRDECVRVCLCVFEPLQRHQEDCLRPIKENLSED